MGSIISKETGSPAGRIQSDLLQAARAGDCDKLARLLEGGVDVNAYDERLDTFPLYHACVGGHREAARMLLEAGADYSEGTSQGKRCYLSALNVGIRRLLREYEADPRARLPAVLLPAFLACPANRATPTDAAGAELSPDIVTLYVEGRRPIHAHRVILAARSPLFRRELTTKWRRNREAALTLKVSYGYYDMSFQSMYSLVRFFYSDRLEVPTEDIEDLARLCQICECEGLLETIDSLFPRKHPDDGERHLVRGHPQKRFVLQRRFAPDRLSSALGRLLQDCLANSREEEDLRNTETNVGFEYDDLADIRVKAGGRAFRCHKMILASRSEYFKARLSRRTGFLQLNDDVLEEHDVSAEAFEKMLHYMYTGELEHLGDGDPLALAEELLDIASRYLLFQLKPVVADLLLPHLDLDHDSPTQLCRWLTISDMYDVTNIREHCLDIIACNFDAFAEERDFRALLLTQTSAPDLLSSLRKRWLGVAAAGLDCRDYGSASQFERLEMLVLAAEQEANDDQGGGSSSVHNI